MRPAHALGSFLVHTRAAAAGRLAVSQGVEHIVGWIARTARLARIARIARLARFGPVGLIVLIVLVAGLAGCSKGRVPSELRSPRANLLFVSIDTTRADRLSLYGNGRPTSPWIDRLAADAIVFENAIAAAPSTAPSHMSLFTGLPPSVHGVRNMGSFGRGRPDVIDTALSRDIHTLAERLEEEGYRSGAFTGGAQTAGFLGFARGFEVYDDTGRTGNLSARRIDLEAPRRWIERASDGPDPWFAFVHTYIPHSPYVPPPELESRFDPEYRGNILGWDALYDEVEGGRGDFERRFWSSVDTDDPRDVEHLLARYDAEVLHADATIVGFLADLERRGLLDDTIVVVTSDHGEEFGEHDGFRHFAKLWEELLHVPLLVRTPRTVGSGFRVREPVSTLELYPTLLDLLALDPDPQALEDSLLPRIEGREPFAERPIVSEYLRSTITAEDGTWEPQKRLRAIRFGRYKWIEDAAPDRVVEHLFDLADDPGERRDLAGDPSARERLASFRALSSRLETYFAPKRRPMESASTSRRTIEQLRALGYIR